MNSVLTNATRDTAVPAVRDTQKSQSTCVLKVAQNLTPLARAGRPCHEYKLASSCARVFSAALLAVGLTTLFLFSGCNRQQPLAPPEVQYGQSECADCGMIVSDQRYAAGLILEMPQGERVPRVFDDIGCMVKYEQRQKDGKVLAHYVMDYQSSRWLTVEQAVLVRRQQIQSPMGYGLAAVSTTEDAQRLAAGDAQAITDFAALLKEKEAPKAAVIAQIGASPR
jgi:copper chaperone NosL